MLPVREGPALGASGLESPSLTGIMKALAAAVKEGGSAVISLIILIILIRFQTPRKAFIYAGLRVFPGTKSR